jgi:hypothetical protein
MDEMSDCFARIPRYRVNVRACSVRAALKAIKVVREQCLDRLRGHDSYVWKDKTQHWTLDLEVAYTGVDRRSYYISRMIGRVAPEHWNENAVLTDYLVD